MSKTIAIILAGGSGNRMGQDIPKQFINVEDKPIIIYTLEAFQNHPKIDEIEVVCREGWESILEAYAKQFGITKLKYIAKPGETSQESIYMGIKKLRDNGADSDDIVVIHDGVRPLVDDFVLSDVIATCEEFGNGVTSLPYNEQIFKVDENDSKTTTEYIPRDNLRRVSTPQAYKFGEVSEAYDEAYAKNIGVGNSSYVNTMMVELGKTLHLASGSDRNIKLTTTADIELFTAILKTKKPDWLK